MKTIDQHLTVLLAEDDPGHASLVLRNLARAGIVNEVIHVVDGQEALDYVYCAGHYAGRKPRGPLLLLLDINMPRVDGVEVLRRLKSDPDLKKLPVIMLTTTDDAREVERCYALGCNEYIQKPVDYDKFAEAIRRLGLFVTLLLIPPVGAK